MSPTFLSDLSLIERQHGADAAHQSLLELLEHQPELLQRPDDLTRRWQWRARRRRIDARRRRREEPLDGEPRLSALGPAHGPAHGDPAELAAGRELAERVVAWLNGCDRQQLVLRVAVLSGASALSTGRALGTSRRTTDRLLAQTRHAARRQFAELFPHESPTHAP